MSRPDSIQPEVLGSQRGMPPNKKTLLIIDDEPNVCDSVHDLLRREYRVLKAHSAEEGYRLMQEEEVHIVMSDQRMPQITGVELLAKVKSRYPYAVRMLFTGFADLDSVIAAINQGHIFGFLKKPWQPEALETAVRQAAAEYDRLTIVERERERLLELIDDLQVRLGTLEAEVKRLGALVPPGAAQSPTAENG
jgi:response regulator RpfG family c-di-GMP phosphodiesterase